MVAPAVNRPKVIMDEYGLLLAMKQALISFPTDSVLQRNVCSAIQYICLSPGERLVPSRALLR